MAYARAAGGSDLFALAESQARERAMAEAIEWIEDTLPRTKGLSPWSDDVKASDDVLDPLFRDYFTRLNLPVLLWKAGYHELAPYVPSHLLPDEVSEKLDAIVGVAKRAKKVT